MKILLIQLARFGDILQTVPTLKALRRENPSAEIHVVVRSSFKEAAAALTEATAIWPFYTEDVLKPLLRYPINMADSTGYVEQFAKSQLDFGFDKIINLSFSPFSSFLCSILDPSASKTSGYTRHTDGYLNIPDDASAYFYAQVGLGRENRVHICDVFAQVAGVNLVPEDFSCEVPAGTHFNLPKNYILIHIGASQKNKTFNSEQWRQVVRGLIDTSDVSVGLVGSKAEDTVAQEITSLIGNERLINLVGHTSFRDLFELVKNASLIIAADSALMNVASLVGTQCLNLSSSAVNYWETGPRTVGSGILYAKTISEINPSDVVNDGLKMLFREKTVHCVAQTIFDVPSFLQNAPTDENLAWQFIKAIYMGGDLPTVLSEKMIMGMMQLREVLSVIMEQIEMIIKGKEGKVHATIIDRSEVLITRIKNLCPELSPLIRWYETEKIRIVPGQVALLAQKTHKICQSLEHVLSLYLGPVGNSNEGVMNEKGQV